MDTTTRKGVDYLRLKSFFPPYQQSRARSWFKNYDPSTLRIFRAPFDNEADEWVQVDAADRCEADINRAEPNVIDLEVVYSRILASHGYESAEFFKIELLRQRKQRKERGVE